MKEAYLFFKHFLNLVHRTLGHEAVHLKNNHAKKAAITGIFIPIGVEAGCRLLQYGVTKLIQKLKRDYKIKKDSKVSHVLRWTQYSIDTVANSYLLKGLLSFYLLYGRFRAHEKEADVESVNQLKNAKSAIDCFKSILKANVEHKESRNDPNYDSQGNYLADLEHPYLTERIAYLEPLAQEQTKVA